MFGESYFEPQTFILCTLAEHKQQAKENVFPEGTSILKDTKASTRKTQFNSLNEVPRGLLVLNKLLTFQAFKGRIIWYIRGSPLTFAPTPPFKRSAFVKVDSSLLSKFATRIWILNLCSNYFSCSASSCFKPKPLRPHSLVQEALLTKRLWGLSPLGVAPIPNSHLLGFFKVYYSSVLLSQQI